MKVCSLLREPHEARVVQAGKDWYLLQLRGCQHGNWCTSFCAGSPAPRVSIWVGIRGTEVTSETNSGNDSNSALKRSHSRTNKGLRNLRSAERSINSHIRFGMRPSQNRR